MNYKKIWSGFTLATGICGLLAITFFAGAGTSAHAVQGYTVSSLTGPFSFEESGSIGNQPFLAVGLVNLDGKGGLNGFTTIRGKSSDSVTATVSGSYVVNNDGTGSMTLQYSSASRPTVNPDDGTTVTGTSLDGSTYNFVLNSANRLRAIRTDGGELVTATLDKQLR